MTRRQTAVLLTSIGLVILGIIAAITIAARFVVHRVEQLASRAVARKEEMADIGTIVTRVRDLNRLETATMRVASVSTIKQSYDLIPNALAGDGADNGHFL